MQQYNLDELRERINLLDQALLNVLFQRMALIPLVAEVKKRDSLAIHQPGREKVIYEFLESYAKENGIGFDVLKSIYQTIITYAKEIEECYINQKESNCYDVLKIEDDKQELEEFYNNAFERLVEYNNLMSSIKDWHIQSGKYEDFRNFMTMLTHNEINKKYL